MRTITIILLFIGSFCHSQVVINSYAFGAVSYDADALSYIARVEATGVTLTTTEKNAINTFVTGLKTNSIWTKITDAALVIGGTANAHSETLKGVADITWNGTVSHSATGATGNGTTGYGNLGIAANSLTFNDVHITAYSRSNLAPSGGADIGSKAATNSTFLALFARSVTNAITYINSNTLGTGGVQVAQATSAGFFIGSRVSSTDLRLFFNGSQIGTTATTTNNGTMPAGNLYIMAYNNNGTAAGFTAREYCFWSWGTGLTTSESATLSTLVNNLQTSLSRNIY